MVDKAELIRQCRMLAQDLLAYCEKFGMKSPMKKIQLKFADLEASIKDSKGDWQKTHKCAAEVRHTLDQSKIRLQPEQSCFLLNLENSIGRQDVMESGGRGMNVKGQSYPSSGSGSGGAVGGKVRGQKLENIHPTPYGDQESRQRGTSPQTQGKHVSTMNVTQQGNQREPEHKKSEAFQVPDAESDRQSLKQQLFKRECENKQLKTDLERACAEKVQAKEELGKYVEKEQEMQIAKDEAVELRKILSMRENDITKLNKDVTSERENVQHLTAQMEKDTAEFKEHWTKAQDEIKRYKHDLKDRENTIRDRDLEIKSLKAEHNDLSTRYSQLASNQLKHNNPDIVDLSDPNRAMKLAERYNDLYNDTWTDAFTAQQELRIPDKAVIQNLLHVLNESFQFCRGLAHGQFESLSNLILHPCPAQKDDLSKPVKRGTAVNQARISSANEKALRDLRRQIMTQNVTEVTKEFLSHMIRRNEEKKCMEASKAYYEKCAEISWLMVLHDPPLCMKTDVKQGSKVDGNYFTVYSKGEKVDYLVWPALLNSDGKGLLAKGVVEVVQKGRK